MRAWLLVAAGLAVAALLAAAPAFACAPTTKAKADPAREEAGKIVTIHGTGFNTNAGPVSIYWGGVGGPLLASGVAVDASGNFQHDVTIPADARPGQYYMQARQDNGTNANFPFEVVSSEPQQPEPPPASSPGDEQPPQDSTSGNSDLPQGAYEPAAPGREAPAEQPASANEASAPADQPADAPAQPSGSTPAQAPSTRAQSPSTTGQSSAPTSSGAAEQPAASTDAAPAQDTAEADEGEPAMAGLSLAERRLLIEAQRPEGALEAPSTGQVQPAPLTGDLGQPASVPVGPSPWLLLPLAAVGLGLLVLGGAMFAHEVRQRRARVTNK